MIGTGNSQDAVVASLMAEDAIAWENVEIFHMDEYVGLSDQHPASFRRWLKTKVAAKHTFAAVHLINGDAEDIEAEIARYSALLSTAPMDVAFIGFGENGHIAFNDPGVADFNDPAVLKVITLDQRCRQQQVGEGHFPDLDTVPAQAVTVTCPELFRSHTWICCVPEARKAEAVKAALENPVDTSCPASVVKEHPQATVYLDHESAALLNT